MDTPVSTPSAEASGPEVAFRVGHAVLPPGPSQRGAVLAAVDAANQRDRLAGLPAEFDVGHRDPAKVAAFLDAWPRLPAPVRARLAGAVVSLDAGPLRLGSASAVLPERLAQGYGLRELAPPRPGQLAALALELPGDAALAARRVSAARALLAEAEQRLAQADAAVARDRSASTLRERSQRVEEAASIAMVWRDLLVDLPAATPAEREAAHAAVARHRQAAPSRGGMP